MSERARLRPGALALVLLAAACGSGDGRPPRDATGQAPAVLLLSCDTLRPDHLGVYGHDRDTSPRLDALAAEGAVFDAAYSTAPMTQPSVSSLMTGRLPEHIGVARGNLRRLPPDVETLAERLSDHGIQTAAVVSNWVLREPEGGAAAEGGVAQGFAHFDDTMEEPEKNRSAFERLAPGTTDAAIAWLETADLAGPFFLWVHYQDPHGPYTPPPELAARYREPGAGDGEPQLPVGRTVLGQGQIPSYQVLDDERRPGVYRDLYDAEIRHFDDELGRLLDWLEEHGVLQRALVIFTADHGESLGEHGYWFCHGENVHREQVRVPLVVRTPPDLPGPRGRVAAVASLIDVWPTVMEAFRLDPGAVPGRSLLGELPADRVVGQTLVPRGDRPSWWAVSDGRYRVIWSDEQPTPRLFDLERDPAETIDLAAQDPDRLARMLTEWNAVVEAGAAGAVGLGRTLEDDPATMEALRKLGYVDGDE